MASTISNTVTFSFSTKYAAAHFSRIASAQEYAFPAATYNDSEDPYTSVAITFRGEPSQSDVDKYTKRLIPFADQAESVARREAEEIVRSVEKRSGGLRIAS